MSSHEHTTAQATEFLAHEDAIALVHEHALPIGTPFLASLRCIDDRAPGTGIPVPGAGLGIIQDTLAGLDAFCKSKRIDHGCLPGDIVRSAEKILGTVSVHTDEDNDHDDVVMCAGCGHCTGTLSNPRAYMMSDTDHEFFIRTYLPHLAQQGVKPVVYSGAHDASAVMIIDDLDVNLPAKLGDVQVYVYHAAWHREILQKVAAQLVKDNRILQVLGEQIRRELADQLVTTAQVRLEETIRQLCRTHPKFFVTRNAANDGYMVVAQK